jgi:hypothetical protein
MESIRVEKDNLRTVESGRYCARATVSPTAHAREAPTIYYPPSSAVPLPSPSPTRYTHYTPVSNRRKSHDPPRIN